MVRCHFQDVSFPLVPMEADMVEITSMALSIVNSLRAFILQMMKKAAKICGL